MNLKSLFGITESKELTEIDKARVFERARAGRELIENATLNAAFEELLNESARKWLATPTGEGTAREQLYYEAQAIAALRGKLVKWVSDAAIEADNLQRKERRKKEI